MVDSHREAIALATTNQHLELSAKRNGTQRRTKVSALHVLQYAKMNKATLNSERIKPVALAIIELHLSEGIS